MLRRAISVIAAVSLVVFPLGVGNAVANQGPQPPATWTFGPGLYEGLFTTPDQWRAQGTVLVDSGFRPYPNGFPFANYGGDFEDNQYLYGLPERVKLPVAKDWIPATPVPMNALALRRTFGNGVCMIGSKIDKRGNCQLTRSAEILAAAISAQAGGGHCFGMAATVAALFNGQMNPNQIGSQVLPNTNNLNVAAQQTMLRLFGTQFFGGADDLLGATPNDVVDILLRDLAGGTVPYILVLAGPGGGHGITPFAVLKRDDGLIEIAVYDNNFPNQNRAVLVDPVSNTFAYSGALNPESEQLLWEGNNLDGTVLGLVPVDNTLAKQRCPVCIGPDQGTFIATSAIDKVNAGLSLELLDLEGNALSPDDYEVLQPLNPPTGKEVSLPMLFVDPGVSYQLVIDGRAMVKPESLEVYVMSNGKSAILVDELFRPGTVSEFIVERSAKSSAYVSTKRSSPRVQEAIEVKGASLVLNGHAESLAAGEMVSQKTNAKRGITVFKTDPNFPSLRPHRWTIQVTFEGLTREVSYAALEVDVATKDSLVLKYKGWDGKSAPELWIDKANDGKLDTKVPMVLVTPALLETLKDQVYVSKGV